MTEPRGFSDPNVVGRNRRDRHMELSREERERLDAIEAPLWEHEAKANILRRTRDEAG